MWYKSTVANDKLPENKEGFLLFPEPHMLFEQEKYYWFVGEFEVDALEGQKPYFCVETFIHGVANTIRPQGILYLDGEIAQGIDINHTRVSVPPIQVPLTQRQY